MLRSVSIPKVETCIKVAARVQIFKVPYEETYSLTAFAALQSANVHGIKVASDLSRAPGGIRNVLDFSSTHLLHHWLRSFPVFSGLICQVMFTEAGVFLEHKVTAPYCSYSVMKQLLCATSLPPACAQVIRQVSPTHLQMRKQRGRCMLEINVPALFA